MTSYRDFANSVFPRPDEERIDDLTLNEDYAYALAWSKLFPDDTRGWTPEEDDES